MITFIGDVHGKFDFYLYYTRFGSKCEPSIQVGDMGIGFRGVRYPDKIEGNHWFIRGNHDDPTACRRHPNYLGDFGIKVIDNLKIFFVSGAFSIDKKWRISGISWWEEEELSYKVLSDQVIPLFKKEQPEIVVTHDCPFAARLLLPFTHHTEERSITVCALDEMFEIFQSKIWIHGHHHVSARNTIKGTKFISLAELELFSLE